MDIPEDLIDFAFEMQELTNRATVFYNDVMPQVEGLALQDYDNLNRLGLLLGKWASLSLANSKKYKE